MTYIIMLYELFSAYVYKRVWRYETYLNIPPYLHTVHSCSHPQFSWFLLWLTYEFALQQKSKINSSCSYQHINVHLHIVFHTVITHGLHSHNHCKKKKKKWMYKPIYSDWEGPLTLGFQLILSIIQFISVYL